MWPNVTEDTFIPCSVSLSTRILLWLAAISCLGYGFQLKTVSSDKDKRILWGLNKRHLILSRTPSDGDSQKITGRKTLLSSTSEFNNSIYWRYFIPPLQLHRWYAVASSKKKNLASSTPFVPEMAKFAAIQACFAVEAGMSASTAMFAFLFNATLRTKNFSLV